MTTSRLTACALQGCESLYQDDPLLYSLLDREYSRQMNTLNMVAASSFADPSVLACEGTAASNVVTEGYPGARFHAGEECHITVNKNRIPGDILPALITSGLCLGTNTLALRGMGQSEMFQCARLIQQVLSAVTVRSEKSYLLDAAVRETVQAEMQELCDRFPIPRYPEAILGNGNHGFALFASQRSEKI